jgi:hypothetical protein
VPGRHLAVAAVKALGLVLLLLARSARAADAAPEQERQLELLRAEVGSEVQLQAAGLLDELVYQWTQQPPFEADTLVVLAGLSVPVGLGTGLEAYLENHFSGLAVKHPATRVQLAHCPACSAWVFHSAAEGTTVSRGFDNPQSLERAGLASSARHALFLDFEAEGSSLVLRARITTLDAQQRIVFARTLSTATGVPALLRSGERLVSAREARQEYLDALSGRLFLVNVRLGVRTYRAGDNGLVAASPFLWLNVGLEASFSQARAWTAALIGGVSWLPDSHVAVQAQAKLARLLTGNTVSLTTPDLYAFVAGSVFFGQGQAMLLFRGGLPTLDDILNTQSGNLPRSTLGMLSIGLELRIKNRIGLVAYLESLPGLEGSQNVGNFLDLGFIRFQAIGVEVSFCF